MKNKILQPTSLGIFAFIALFFCSMVMVSCGKNTDPVDDPDDPVVVDPKLGTGSPGLVGTAGLNAWDALPVSEKDRIKAWNTIFLHQSVGQDLEEGCKANGFPFEYFGPEDIVDKGLMGGIFVDVGGIANGDPFEKIRVFKEAVQRSKGKINIAIFKFGYADIQDENHLSVQAAYLKMVDDLRKDLPDLRWVHMTPPLVYSVESYDGNAARMKVGEWMRKTLASKDVVFDLQALESNDGVCQQGGVWRICPENRNSASDPSDVNGIDTSDGQGHLGKKAAQRISKAFLMAIYNAAK
ncbi:MAG: hypothetical protein U0V54_12305 [Saprospiraceae bacterium]|nr:hypothetical protein [Saprospiraceae bacterium]